VLLFLQSVGTAYAQNTPRTLRPDGGPAADPELAALLARLQQLTPERQQLVKELIKALAG